MRPTPALGFAALLAACAAGTRYADLPEKNVVVRAEISGAQAVLGVHAVDAQCKLTYEGFVALDQPVVRVGIPADRTSYLVFEFATSSFWGGRRGSISRETLLRTRAGSTYDVRVTYKDDLYDVAIREIPARGGRVRDVEFAPLRACKP
ncbi:MAG: hypothetical protein OEW90_13640 [Betaproteobacteria bacterium]|nr:hypothetical protein [Betaproteobacteria bacterium]